MMRHGIPTATNSLSQELAIATGALDAAVVDYQCIMPSLPWAAKKFHTAIITTMPIAKMPGATHIEFDEKHAGEKAQEILRAGDRGVQEARSGQGQHSARRQRRVGGYVGRSDRQGAGARQSRRSAQAADRQHRQRQHPGRVPVRRLQRREGRAGSELRRAGQRTREGERADPVHRLRLRAVLRGMACSRRRQPRNMPAPA